MGFGERVSPSTMGKGSVEGARFFLIFQLKMARYCGFWVLFLGERSGCVVGEGGECGDDVLLSRHYKCAGDTGDGRPC